MKKNIYCMLAVIMAAATVLSIDYLRQAFFFDTKIAYADPTLTYVYGSDGSEHAALCNFYPRTHDHSNPSEWGGGANVDWGQVRSSLNMTKKALNACRVVETRCEQEDDNLCPFTLTGVAIVTPQGEVHQLWNNPF
jgi:hypothetical protein